MKFNSNMFQWGDVVYSSVPQRNVILSYKEIPRGFEYVIGMKPEKTLIKKLYICIMNFIRSNRRFIF